MWCCCLQIKSGSIACLLSENGELRKDVLDKLEEVCRHGTSVVDNSLFTSAYPQLQSVEIEPMPSIGEFLK